MSHGGTIIKPDGLADWCDTTWWWHKDTPLGDSLNLEAMERLEAVLDQECPGSLGCSTEFIGDLETGITEAYFVPPEEAIRVASVLTRLATAGRLDESWDAFIAFCEAAGMSGEGFCFS